MSDLTIILTTAVGLYALLTGCYLILENRRPQASLAWMLVFIFAPGIGLIVYILFGRSTKAFSRQTDLLKQDLEGDVMPLLAPRRAREEAELANLASRGFVHQKLVMLIRRNSASAITTGNQVEIQQDAAIFYPSLMQDMKAARHSIHQDHRHRRGDRLHRRHEHRSRAPGRRPRLRFLARYADPPGRRCRCHAAGGVHGRLVQRGAREPVPAAVLPESAAADLRFRDRCRGGGAGARLRARLAVGGHPAVVFRDDRVGARTRLAAVAVLRDANIDIRSFSINYELNAVLYSRRLAQELETQFEADLQGCVPFDADAYRRSSLALRLRDSVARLFSPLL